MGCPGQKVFKLVKWPNEFHDDPMVLANALRVSLQAGPRLLRCWGLDVFLGGLFSSFQSVQECPFVR